MQNLESHVTHNNLLDVSHFDMPIKKIDNPTVLLPDINGKYLEQVKMDNQTLVYRPDTMDILGRSRSKQYKIVEPTELYTAHAKKLLEQKDLPLSDVIVDDYIYEGGRKQKRTVTFPSLTKKIEKSEVAMRSDIFNSVDMSWMYQAFAGAYRNLCQNSLVFGGQRMYHIKQKHTKGLNVISTLKSVAKTFELFNENQELMDKMLKQEISLKTMAHILAGNICKKKESSKKLLDDTSISVNYKLLDYFIDRIEQESGNLGYTVWNLYNALTHWSTHIDDTFERLDDKGIAHEVKMTRAGSKIHTARTKREDRVREFMNSEDWQKLLANTYIFTALHPNIQERLN